MHEGKGWSRRGHKNVIVTSILFATVTVMALTYQCATVLAEGPKAFKWLALQKAFSEAFKVLNKILKG
jgi:hypothetical protein